MAAWSPSANSSCSPPIPETPGYSTSPTNWRFVWPGTAPEPIHLEETDASFAIEWKGHYRIEGPAFVYADRDTGRVTTILGYPTQKIAQAG